MSSKANEAVFNAAVDQVSEIFVEDVWRHEGSPFDHSSRRCLAVAAVESVTLFSVACMTDASRNPECGSS
jgi:hypothetical protein